MSLHSSTPSSSPTLHLSHHAATRIRQRGLRPAKVQRRKMLAAGVA